MRNTPKDTKETPDSGPERRAWLGPILLLASLFYINFTGRVLLAPLLPDIETRLAISHEAAGSLFFFISAGYFVSLIASGFVSSALTHRRTVILSALLAGLALLCVSAAASLPGLRAAAVFLGFATGLYLPSGIATVTGMVPPQNWGKALGVHELAPNLAFATAPFIAQAALSLGPWRTVPAAAGVLSLAAAALFLRYGKGGEHPGQAPSPKALLALLRLPGFWLMGALFSLGIAGTLGIYTMLPLYLVTEAGCTKAAANTLVGLSRVLSVGMALVAGAAADRLGARRAMAAVFLLSGASTVCMGLSSGVFLKALVFVQAVVAVCFFPAGFMCLARLGPAGARNVAVSLAVPLAFVAGGGLVPWAVGYMGERASFALGLSAVGALILSGAVLALGAPDGTEKAGEK
jgi:NNP family nitrate/nitrite transporter-like MFS transporter